MAANFSDRSKLELEFIIKKFKEDTFDEDDIKLLLIQWRANFKSLNLIWELACFISHPEERDKGIFHKELDVRYAKIIYGVAIGGPFSKKLNATVIEQKLYNTLLIGGIETIDATHLMKNTGLSKSQAKGILIGSYIKKANLYYIKPQKDYKKLESIIDSILNLINLTVSINNKQILEQFNIALTETIKILGLNLDPLELIEKNKNKIIICLMCLIHSHNFTLYDKSTGSCRLELGIDRDRNWVLYLYATTVLNISWPLMELSGDLFKHIDELPKTVNLGDTFKLKGFNAIRDNNGELKIKNKNVC